MIKELFFGLIAWYLPMKYLIPITTAGVGIHSIIYNYISSNGCVYTNNQNITVNALPLVSYAYSGSLICINSPFFTLTGGNPLGGNYSGTGVSNNKFYPASAGIGWHTITYSYQDNNQCSNSAIDSIYVNACTGIPTEQEFPKIELYPNPTNQFLNVKTVGEIPQKICISDFTGRVLIENYPLSSKTRIDLSDLVIGIYFIKIYSGKTNQVFKLVKQEK